MSAHYTWISPFNCPSGTIILLDVAIVRAVSKLLALFLFGALLIGRFAWAGAFLLLLALVAVIAAAFHMGSEAKGLDASNSFAISLTALRLKNHEKGSFFTRVFAFAIAPFMLLIATSGGGARQFLAGFFGSKNKLWNDLRSQNSGARWRALETRVAIRVDYELAADLLLDDDQTHIRWCAMRYAGKGSVTKIRETAAKGSDADRFFATCALLRLKDQPVLDVENLETQADFLSTLDQPMDSVYAAAVGYLPCETFGTRILALTGRDANLLQVAFEGVRAQAGPAATEVLLKATRSQDPTVVRAAMLKLFGRNEPEVRVRVSELTMAEDSVVRQTARMVLRSLETSPVKGSAGTL